MPNAFEEALRFYNNPQAVASAMSLPVASPYSGAQAYTIPGEGTARFIGPKSPSEIARAAAALVQNVGASAPAGADWSGRAIGDSPGAAFGAALSKRGQDIQVAQFNAQLAQAQEDRAFKERIVREDMAQKERLARLYTQGRANVANTQASADIQEALIRAATAVQRGAAGGRRVAQPMALSPGPAVGMTGGAGNPAIGPTVADLLHDQVIQTRAGIASTADPILRDLLSRAASFSQANAEAAFIPQDGVPVFTDPDLQNEFLRSTALAPVEGAEGPAMTVQQALASLAAQRQSGQQQIDTLRELIDAARESKRLDQIVPTAGAQAAPISPLVQALLAQRPSRITPEGQFIYDAAQVARTQDPNWRGAYGGTAFGTSFDERVRARQAALGRAARAELAGGAPMVAPAVPASGGLPSGEYVLNAPVPGIEAEPFAAPAEPAPPVPIDVISGFRQLSAAVPPLNQTLANLLARVNADWGPASPYSGLDAVLAERFGVGATPIGGSVLTRSPAATVAQNRAAYLQLLDSLPESERNALYLEGLRRSQTNPDIARFLTAQ